MPEIKKGVGDRGDNDHSDAALIQAMLVVVKNAKGISYLDSYDGVVGKNTKNAIIAFQQDHVFMKQGGWTDAGTGLKQAVPDATPGLIKPNDATFKKLVALLPAACKGMNILPGGKTVYIAASGDQVEASRKEVTTNADLEVNFRGKVASLINGMYEKHKIVLWVTPPWADGTRRTFEAQYQLTFKLQNGKPVTNAGPGESNHNYGQAVDIGFKGVQWLRKDGTPVENETHWLHKLDPQQKTPPEALRFWEAMRNVATEPGVGLFRGPAGDRPHIQAWNDAQVNMPKRLAALLNQVGKMKWSRGAAQYESDFGLGGTLYPVGTAKQIWGKQANVTKENLAKARTEALKKDAIKAGPQSALWKNFKPVLPAAIKAAEIDDMREALRGEFDAADQRWKKWKPI